MYGMHKHRLRAFVLWKTTWRENTWSLEQIKFASWKCVYCVMYSDGGQPGIPNTAYMYVRHFRSVVGINALALCQWAVGGVHFVSQCCSKRLLALWGEKRKGRKCQHLIGGMMGLIEGGEAWHSSCMLGVQKCSDRLFLCVSLLERRTHTGRLPPPFCNAFSLYAWPAALFFFNHLPSFIWADLFTVLTPSDPASIVMDITWQLQFF